MWCLSQWQHDREKKVDHQGVGRPSPAFLDLMPLPCSVLAQVGVVEVWLEGENVVHYEI